MNKALSIIIPVYNNLKGLQQTVADIRKSEMELMYEIIVCNDGANRQISDWLADSGLKEVAIEHRKGSYFARNRGIEVAKSEVLLFVDADTIVQPGWFELVAEKWERNDYLAFDINLKIKPTDSWLKQYSAFSEFQCHSYWSKNHFGPTAFLMVKKRIFTETGLFDESLASGGDLELGNRCWHAGFKMTFIENSHIYHLPRSLWAKYKKQVRVYQGIKMLGKKFPNRLMQLPEISFLALFKSPLKILYTLYHFKNLSAYTKGKWSAASTISAEFIHQVVHAIALAKVLTTNKKHFD